MQVPGRIRLKEKETHVIFLDLKIEGRYNRKAKTEQLGKRKGVNGGDISRGDTTFHY